MLGAESKIKIETVTPPESYPKGKASYAAPSGRGLNKKLCKKCLRWKASSKFSKCKSRKDGLFNLCRLCRSEYRSQLLLSSRKTREGAKRRQIRYKEKHRKKVAKYYLNHPKIRKAQSIITNYIRKFERPSMKCAICGLRQATHFHHPNYNYAYKVIPVDALCHSKIGHGRIKVDVVKLSKDIRNLH